MKTALLFPGQGNQYSGMGKEVYEHSPWARLVFEYLEGIKAGLKDTCFLAEKKDELNITVNTQPCIFAVQSAYARALDEAEIKIDGVAGFSLGEISALSYSKMLCLKDAMELIMHRAEFMQECCKQNHGSMAAVINLEPQTVEEICKSYDDLWAVNYNSPVQTVIAGNTDSIDSASVKIKELSGKIIRLNVSGAFHSPYMSKASDNMLKYLENIEFSTPEIQVYSNVTAKEYSGDFRELIARHISSPVRFADMIKNMRSDGFDTFIEAGGGKTLAGLIKKIDPDFKVLVFDKFSDLENIKEQTSL